jgi:CCR4-NOT transcription complex subunit 1
LDNLLDIKPFTLALDVAALASRREYLNLDKWLADNISKYKAEFIRAVMDFLEAKAANEKEARVQESPENHGKTMTLNPQTVAIFLRVLRNNSALLSPQDVDICLEIRNTCLQIYPRLMSLIPGTDQEPGFSVTSYSTDVEKEVDGLYRQMYEETLSVDQVINMLERFKGSKNPREHEIFACMLHFLFDEFRFFNTYPTPQLALTAYLFGSLIEFSLVDYIPLGIAIRYILDALQCPPESNLFKFAIMALARFERRLPEWTPLCQALLQIPHLAEARPDLINNIRRILNDAENQGGGAPQAAAVPEPHQRPFTTIHVEALPEEQLIEPSEDTSDKILFIINNLVASNLKAKVAEISEKLDDSLLPWLAKYLVEQRVSIEPNNHELYRDVIVALDKKAMWNFVARETFAKAIALLNAESTQKSTQERTTLKNLGSWLGSVTLRRDKPILHKHMAFKEFLLEGFDTNRLIVAIPFVCKILEGAAKSKVFQPPNPWLMGTIDLLAELYHYAELKLNLKFEIEVLCKTLGLDLDTIEPTTILRNRPLADQMPEFLTGLDEIPLGMLLLLFSMY